METLTDFLNEPGVQQFGATAFALLLYRLAVMFFNWQSKEAETEGKQAEAQAEKETAFTQLALAIGTLASTAQVSAEAIRKAAEVSQASTEAIRQIGDSIAMMVKENQAFHANVETHHQQQSLDFEGLKKQLEEVAKEMTAEDMNGKLDQVLAALLRIEAYIADIKPDVEELHTRLERAEKEVIEVKQEVFTIKAKEAPHTPTAAPSKTQARSTSEQEAPIVPPQESTDKPLTDAPASGG